jgi:hypothetical protein
VKIIIEQTQNDLDEQGNDQQITKSEQVRLPISFPLDGSPLEVEYVAYVPKGFKFPNTAEARELRTSMLHQNIQMASMQLRMALMMLGIPDE